MFIFFIGAGSLAYFQVEELSDQVDQLNRTADGLDARVKRAEYEKTKFFHIARDILQLAGKDPNADAVATRFKLRKLAEAKPELMNANTPSDLDLANLNTGQSLAAPGAMTSAAPMPLTNAAPVTNAPPAKAPSAP